MSDATVNGAEGLAGSEVEAVPALDLAAGRKGEILEAAASVFAERGYDAGSMRDIATRVGVTEPALYRHFSGKEAIFLALLTVVGGRLRSEAIALIECTHAPRIREQLIAAFADRRAQTKRLAPVMRTVLSAISHNPTFLAEYRRILVEPLRVALLAKATELDAEFGVADGSATREGRVRALMSLFVGYFVTSFVLGDEPDEPIADAALRVMGWESR
jgi:AcrR family transcriptional regulator